MDGTRRSFEAENAAAVTALREAREQGVRWSVGVVVAGGVGLLVAVVLWSC